MIKKKEKKTTSCLTAKTVKAQVKDILTTGRSVVVVSWR